MAASYPIGPARASAFMLVSRQRRRALAAGRGLLRRERGVLPARRARGVAGRRPGGGRAERGLPAGRWPMRRLCSRVAPVSEHGAADSAATAFPHEAGAGSREGRAPKQKDQRSQCFHETADTGWCESVASNLSVARGTDGSPPPFPPTRRRGLKQEAQSAMGASARHRSPEGQTGRGRRAGAPGRRASALSGSNRARGADSCAPARTFCRAAVGRRGRTRNAGSCMPAEARGASLRRGAPWRRNPPGLLARFG